jgi:hypothetical protein
VTTKAGAFHVPFWSLFVPAALSSLALPAMSTVQRLYWGRLVGAQRSAAYNRVAITQELAILVGRLLFAVILAGSSGFIALGIVATLSGIGAAALAAALPADASQSISHPFMSRGVLSPGMR